MALSEYFVIFFYFIKFVFGNFLSATENRKTERERERGREKERERFN